MGRVGRPAAIPPRRPRSQPLFPTRFCPLTTPRLHGGRGLVPRPVAIFRPRRERRRLSRRCRHRPCLRRHLPRRRWQPPTRQRPLRVSQATPHRRRRTRARATEVPTVGAARPIPGQETTKGRRVAPGEPETPAVPTLGQRATTAAPMTPATRAPPERRATRATSAVAAEPVEAHLRLPRLPRLLRHLLRPRRLRPPARLRLLPLRPDRLRLLPLRPDRLRLLPLRPDRLRLLPLRLRLLLLLRAGCRHRPTFRRPTVVGCRARSRRVTRSPSCSRASPTLL